MNWFQALANRLIADAACQAIAGNRWDWHEREQTSALPCGVLEEISSARDQDMDGPIGQQRARVQVNCLAARRDDAVDLSDAAIAALLPGGVFDGVTFSRGMIENISSDAEVAGGQSVFRRRFDLVVWHD